MTSTWIIYSTQFSFVSYPNNKQAIVWNSTKTFLWLGKRFIYCKNAKLNYGILLDKCWVDMQVKTFVYFYICLTVHLANGNISPDIEQQCKDVQDSHMCFFNLLKNNTEINRTTLIIQEEYFWHPVKRKRKDCRALSEKERNDLFSAINALRKDKVSMSRFFL